MHIDRNSHTYVNNNRNHHSCAENVSNSKNEHDTCGQYTRSNTTTMRFHPYNNHTTSERRYNAASASNNVDTPMFWNRQQSTDMRST